MGTIGIDTWESDLERFVSWADMLELSPREGFDRLAQLLKNEHFGIESVILENTHDNTSAPSAEYLNMGDTYATTLILTDDYENGTSLIVSSWGNWYESAERWYCDDQIVIRCGYCGQFTEFDSDSDWYNHICGSCGNCVSG